MIFKKYVFVLLAAMGLICVPVFAISNIFKQDVQWRTSMRKPEQIDTKYTPEKYLKHIIQKRDTLFWKLIQDYCPAHQESCYGFKEEIEQDLETMEKKLTKKPKIHAYRDPEIPQKICDAVDKELEKKGIYPGNVSLCMEDFEKDTWAETIFHPDTLQFSIVFNRKLFLTSSDNEDEKRNKKLNMGATIFHEPVHVKYLDPLKDAYIRIAKDRGKNQIMLDELKKKKLAAMEKKFERLEEFIADIEPVLKDPEIVYLRIQQECIYGEWPYNRITKKNKYTESEIHPSAAYMCYKLKKLPAMYRNVAAQSNSNTSQ